MPKPTRSYDRLKGKIAIVTGSGSDENSIGIGAAIAIAYAKEGAKVCITDIDYSRAEKTLEIIKEENGEAFCVEADVTCSQDCAKIVAATTEKYDGLDILVNNVGISSIDREFESIDENDWQHVLNTNLNSAFLMSKNSIERLKESRGNIVNIASISALRAIGGATAYSCSKAAIIAMNNDLAVLYGPSGIRCNVVSPGHLFTPLVERSLTEDLRTLRRNIAPLQIEGDPWDVAMACIFLASEDARFITSACLPVDGGVSQISPLSAHSLVS